MATNPTLAAFLASAGVHIKKGTIRKSTGRAATPQDLQALYGRYMLTVTDPADAVSTFAQFEPAIRENLESGAESAGAYFATCSHIDELVAQAFDEKHITIGPKGESAFIDGIAATFEEVETAARHHYYEYVDDSKDEDGKPSRKIWSMDTFTNALRFFVQNKDKRERLTLREVMTYAGPEAEKWTAEAIDEILADWSVQGDAELAREVLRHWFWQVKRYIHGLPVLGPLFVNIFGEQGSGKSTMIKHLCAPIREYLTVRHLSDIEKEQNIAIWTRNYVVLFDELSIKDRGPSEMGPFINQLKMLLTSDTISARVLYSSNQQNQPRTFSPISASNDSIVSVIYDPTGMRRFFEIVLGAKKGPDVIARCQHLENMPAVRFWSGIDHTREAGYIPIGSEMYARMAAVQDTYKRHDALDWALDGVDYGDLPVQADHLAENGERAADVLARVLSTCTTEPAVESALAGTGLVLLPHQVVRRRLAEYLDDEFDREFTKYLSRGERFLAALASRGYCVTTRTGHRATQFSVLCAPPADGPSKGKGVGI